MTAWAQPLQVDVVQDPSKAILVMTPALALKALAAVACGALSVYLLNTGKRDHDAGRLLWGGLLALLAFLIF